MKKTIVITATVLSVLMMLAPFLVMLGVVFLAPSQHSHTFYGALNEKVERLDSIKGPKLVVIGGSSVAFGLDSALLEEYIGMPVVNFGLYADLGTKLMLDLSEDAIGEGDVILLSPELDAQTLSMYFSGRSTWLAIDDETSLVLRLDSGNLSSMWGSAWGFATEKLSYLSGKKKIPNPKGAYNARNFNEYGDIYYVNEVGESLRTKNGMYKGRDAGTPIGADISVFAPEFLDYLNAYAKRMKEKGATVYYNWCPINRLAISDGGGWIIDSDGAYPSERIAAFEAALADALDFEIIGSYGDYVYDSSWFFDTNFHLNSAATSHHTANIVRDLSLAHLGEEITVPSDKLADISGLN